MEETTIAAISTAMSASGIGIVRISGPEAFEIASGVYRSKGGKKSLKNVPSHTIHYGYIYDNEEMVDEVLVMAMRGPRTYTGEDKRLHFCICITITGIVSMTCSFFSVC